MNSEKIKRLSTNSMLAALCAVLGYFAIDAGNIKFTLETFPMILGAMLFGPASGVSIAFVGNFISQLVKYGLTATTLVWIITHVVSGLAVGLYARKKDFNLTRGQAIAIALAGEILVTLLNTGAMYIDAKFYGYYTFAYVFGASAMRAVVCVVKGVVYGVILHPLLTAIKRALK